MHWQALWRDIEAPSIPFPPAAQVNIALVLEEIEKLTTVFEFRIPPNFALILRTFSVIEVRRRGWAGAGWHGGWHAGHLVALADTTAACSCCTP